nr:hypothetical protein [Tanacetum cinerariifolium]
MKIKELIKKDELAIAYLEGVGLGMLKRKYKNYVKLEYHVDQLKVVVLEEDQWSNGESDLDFYYLVYLGMEEKYTSSLTKHFATRYRIKDDMEKDLFKVEIGNRSTLKVYSDKRMIDVVSVNVKKMWGCGFLTSIKVKGTNNKEYEFSYADLPRLSLNEIKDIVVIKNRVEVVQLGVESYQRTLNLTKPNFYFLGIDRMISYTTFGTKKGVIDLNKHDMKSLMKLDEVHKF